MRDERDDDDTVPNQWAIKRVIGWSLEDAEKLRLRRQRAEDAAKERRERQALETVAAD